MALEQMDLWAKIVRAEESIKNLDAEITQYLASDPKPYRIVGELHNDDREYGFTAYSDPVPLRFSIIAGEIVHHLRSALDHVIWAMATRNNRNPRNRIQFPICDTPPKFEKALKNGIVQGVGDVAVKIIEGVQPFKSEDPRDAILYVLHDFDVTDKHKLLPVITTAAQIGEVITIGDSRGSNPPPGRIDKYCSSKCARHCSCVRARSPCLYRLFWGTQS